METYLIKVSILIGLFAFWYKVFYSRNADFQWNRYYLVVSLLLSFLLPVLKLPFSHTVPDLAMPEIKIIPGNFNDLVRNGDVTPNQPIPQNTMSPFLIGGIIYGIGIMLLFGRLCFSLWKILQLKKTARKARHNNTVLYCLEGIQPFCFVRSIFVPYEHIDIAVLRHEEAHVVQRHWIDLFIVEFASIVLWFNPVVWYYKKAIQQQHEFLADEYVLSGGISTEHYLKSILEYLSCPSPIGPLNKFNSTSLKQRIVMMTNEKKRRLPLGLYLCVIPLFAIALLAFTRKSTRFIDERPVTDNLTVVIDAGHGGTDAGAKSSSGLTEKDITLSIANLVRTIGKERGIEVVVTRGADESKSLQERVDVATKAKADVFLSIHAGHDNEGTTTSGIDIHISEQNPHFDKSKRFAMALFDQLRTIEEIPLNNLRSTGAYVLKNNSVPAVIVELGYLSNPNDSDFLRNPANQETIARKIVDGLDSYQK